MWYSIRGHMSATLMNEGRFELYFDSRIGSFWNSRSMNVLHDAEDRRFAVQIFNGLSIISEATRRRLVADGGGVFLKIVRDVVDVLGKHVVQLLTWVSTHQVPRAATISTTAGILRGACGESLTCELVAEALGIPVREVVPGVQEYASWRSPSRSS